MPLHFDYHPSLPICKPKNIHFNIMKVTRKFTYPSIILFHFLPWFRVYIMKYSTRIPGAAARGLFTWQQQRPFLTAANGLLWQQQMGFYGSGQRAFMAAANGLLWRQRGFFLQLPEGFFFGSGQKIFFWQRPKDFFWQRPKGFVAAPKGLYGSSKRAFMAAERRLFGSTQRAFIEEDKGLFWQRAEFFFRSSPR